jgi:apoptosis regulator BAX
MVAQVPIDSPYETFSDVAKELFCDGIYNWGRIVTLFYFTYKLIMKVSSRRENRFLLYDFGILVT